MSPRWFRYSLISSVALILWAAPFGGLAADSEQGVGQDVVKDTYPAVTGSPAPVSKAASSPVIVTAVGKPGAPTKRTGAKAEIPALLKEIEAKYQQTGTFSSDILQITVSGTLGQKKTNKGVLMSKRPNKFRWETFKPDPSLLVSDGKTAWYYTPPFDEGERGQVIIRKAREFSSKLANALIMGSFSRATGMRIESKDTSTFMLFPRKGTAATVKSAEIKVDPDKKLIERVLITNRDGGTSEIQLSNVELGKSIDERMFVFVPPADVEQVTE